MKKKGASVAIVSQTTSKKAPSGLRNKGRENSPPTAAPTIMNEQGVVSPFIMGNSGLGNFTHRSSMDQAILLNKKSLKGGKKLVRDVNSTVKSQQRKYNIPQHNNFMRPQASQQKIQTKTRSNLAGSNQSKRNQSRYQTQSQFATFSNVKSRLSNGNPVFQQSPPTKYLQRSPPVVVPPRDLLPFSGVVSQGSPVLNYRHSREGSPAHKDLVHSSQVAKVLNVGPTPQKHVVVGISYSQHGGTFIRNQQTGKQQSMPPPAQGSNATNTKKLKENIHRQVISGAGTFDLHFKRASKGSPGTRLKPITTSKQVGLKKAIVNSVPKKASKSKITVPINGKPSISAKKPANPQGSPPPHTSSSKLYPLYRVSEEKAGQNFSGGGCSNTSSQDYAPPCAAPYILPFNLKASEGSPNEATFFKNAQLPEFKPMNLMREKSRQPPSEQAPITKGSRQFPEKSPGGNKISAAALERFLLQSSQRQNNDIIASILRNLSSESKVSPKSREQPKVGSPPPQNTQQEAQSTQSHQNLLSSSTKFGCQDTSKRTPNKCQSSPAKPVSSAPSIGQASSMKSNNNNIHQGMLRAALPMMEAIQQKAQSFKGPIFQHEQYLEDMTSPSPTVNPFKQLPPTPLQQATTTTPLTNKASVKVAAAADKENVMVLSNEAASYKGKAAIAAKVHYINKQAMLTDENAATQMMKSTKKPLGFGLRNQQQHEVTPIQVFQMEESEMPLAPLRLHNKENQLKKEEEIDVPLKDLLELRRQQKSHKMVEDLSPCSTAIVREFAVPPLVNTTPTPLSSSSGELSRGGIHPPLSNHEDLKKQLIEGILSAQADNPFRNQFEKTKPTDIILIEDETHFKRNLATPRGQQQLSVRSYLLSSIKQQNRKYHQSSSSSAQTIQHQVETPKSSTTNEPMAVVPPLNFDRVIFSSDRHHYPQNNSNVQVLHSKQSKAVFINKAPAIQTSSSISSSENSSARLLHNSLASAADLHRQVEAKLHRMQYGRVFLEPSAKRDDLCAYFIKKYQIAQGLIPDPKKLKEQRRAQGLTESESTGDDEFSEISNFSMEIEMLNRLHITKNNRHKLSELPVMADQLLPDPTCELYKETVDPTTGCIKFIVDERPRVQFKNPITTLKQRPSTTGTYQQAKLEGSLTGKLNGMHLARLDHHGDSAELSQIGMHLQQQDGGAPYNNMSGNKYFESSGDDNSSCYRGRRGGGGHHKNQGHSNYSSSPAGMEYDGEDTYSHHREKAGGPSKEIRRRIDQQFTSSSAKYYVDRDAVELHDIRVQPFAVGMHSDGSQYHQRKHVWNANSSSDDEEAALSHLHQLRQQQLILQQQLLLMQQLSEQQQQHSSDFLMPAMIPLGSRQRSLVGPQQPPLDLRRGISMAVGYDYRQEEALQDFEGIQELSSDLLKPSPPALQRRNDSNPFSIAAQSQQQQQELIYLHSLNSTKHQKRAKLNADLCCEGGGSANSLGDSYDAAVREFKWLQNYGRDNGAAAAQDELDHVLTSGQEKAVPSETTQEKWLMRPFDLQEPRVSIPVQPHLMVKSDSISPPSVIRNAPVKKAQHYSNGWSSSSGCDRRASHSDASSCNVGDHRLGRPNKHIRRLHEVVDSHASSDFACRMGIELFKNPMVKATLANESQPQKRLFEEGDINVLESARHAADLTLDPNKQLDTSSDAVIDDSKEPYNFQTQQEIQEFLTTLRAQLGVPSSDFRIYPSVKWDASAFERLAPAIYNQVPLLMLKNQNSIALEFFDFDKVAGDERRPQSSPIFNVNTSATIIEGFE